MDKKSWPAWFYHASCPQGNIFESEKDLPEGWVDSPSKIDLAPSFKKRSKKEKLLEDSTDETAIETLDF